MQHRASYIGKGKKEEPDNQDFGSGKSELFDESKSKNIQLYNL
jgi:hypothetical protein